MKLNLKRTDAAEVSATQGAEHYLGTPQLHEVPNTVLFLHHPHRSFRFNSKLKGTMHQQWIYRICKYIHGYHRRERREQEPADKMVHGATMEAGRGNP